MTSHEGLDNLTVTQDHNNDTDWGIPPRHHLAVSLMYTFAYLSIFILGVAGNTFVLCLITRDSRFHTAPHIFIGNLAVADLLVMLFCVPSTLMTAVFVPWILGRFMCKMVAYVQGVSVSASVNSLVAVSVDRFLAICYPLRVQITKRRARIIILIIWLVALVMTLPWALFFDLVTEYPDFPDVKMCLEVWPEPSNKEIYFLVAQVILCYLVPLVVIATCYLLIWIRVRNRHIPGDTKDEQMERIQQRSKFKVVKMLIVVVILFMLSWLPLYAIFIRIKFAGPLDLWEEWLFSIAVPIAQWLGSANSCINPILYAFFNAKYRRGFIAILKSRKCCGHLKYDRDESWVCSRHTTKSKTMNGKISSTSFEPSRSSTNSSFISFKNKIKAPDKPGDNSYPQELSIELTSI